MGPACHKRSSDRAIMGLGYGLLMDLAPALWNVQVKTLTGPFRR